MSDPDVQRVMNAANGKMEDFLEVAGAMVESNAVREALVDTGRYRGSMGHIVENGEAIIGANVEYAVIIEVKHKPVLRIALAQSMGPLRRLFRATTI